MLKVGVSKYSHLLYRTILGFKIIGYSYLFRGRCREEVSGYSHCSTEQFCSGRFLDILSPVVQNDVRFPHISAGNPNGVQAIVVVFGPGQVRIHPHLPHPQVKGQDLVPLVLDTQSVSKTPCLTKCNDKGLDPRHMKRTS